jgi:hypothetical protein
MRDKGKPPVEGFAPFSYPFASPPLLLCFKDPAGMYAGDKNKKAVGSTILPTACSSVI